MGVPLAIPRLADGGVKPTIPSKLNVTGIAWATPLADRQIAMHDTPTAIQRKVHVLFIRIQSSSYLALCSLAHRLSFDT